MDKEAQIERRPSPTTVADVCSSALQLTLTTIRNLGRSYTLSATGSVPSQLSGYPFVSHKSTMRWSMPTTLACEGSDNVGLLTEMLSERTFKQRWIMCSLTLSIVNRPS